MVDFKKKLLLMQARARGERAAREKKVVGDNPYPDENTEEFWEWMAGYVDQRMLEHKNK